MGNVSNLISVEELQTAISQRITAYNGNDNPINQRATVCAPLLSADGKILAEDIYSTMDIPRQNLSAMDGYAIAKGTDLTENSTIDIIGESQAGKPFINDKPLQAGQGVRIFTGAVVPNDCDCVVMQENTNHQQLRETQSIDKNTIYQIQLTTTAKVGANIRKQGEEIATDELIYRKGKLLNPTDINVLANLGVAEVNIYQPLIVGILATGDELVQVGQPLTNLAQIYNSNTPTLKSLLKNLPITIKDYGIIADDFALTKQTVAQAVTECDVLISTAGVSVGDYDYLTEVIHQLGKINHYKVAMKPGKPFVFGELTKDSSPVLFFGLPGNPLSTVVGCLQFIIPALWQLSGVGDTLRKPFAIKAITVSDIKKRAGRADYQRGVLSQNEQGTWQVSVFDKQQSHRVKQLAQSNCLVVLDKDSEDIKAGAEVVVQPFAWYHS